MPYKVLGAIQGEPWVKDGKSVPKVMLTVNYQGKDITVGYFTKETPANLIGKELDFTVEEKQKQDGSSYYVAKKPKNDSGGGRFEKSDITIRLEILKVIGDGADKWTALLNVEDPLKVADKLFQWVKK